MTEIAHTEHRDYVGAKLGMWFFLFTEVLLFGGMFLVYSVYREVNSADFHEAGMEMNVVIGAVNTIILLTSSLTMALSISAIKKGAKNISVLLQLATVLLGVAFLVNKYFEWGAELRAGHYPLSDNFFQLYYVLTGIHLLHVLVALVVVAYLWRTAGKVRNLPTARQLRFIENGASYWHMVDLIWLGLFALFYLTS